MTLEQIIQSKIANLEDVPDTFIDLVNKQNEGLFKELLKLLGELDTADGIVLQTDKNVRIITQVNERMRQVLFEGEYVEGLKTFVSSFSEQAGLIDSILSKQGFEIDEKSIYKSLLQQSQKSTLLLLDEDAIGKALAEPLQNNLLTSVYNGGKYSDMIQSMKDFILGNDELDPKLTTYVKRYARDTISTFDRTYTQLVSENAGVEYYAYSGGTLKDSRDFCLERVGNVYTKDEIISWADEDWKGKNPATDAATIFSYCGGYNCVHSLIPTDVPPDEIDEVNKYNAI